MPSTTAPKNYAALLDAFLQLPPHQQLAIKLGTFALFNILSRPRPTTIVARVNAFLRAMLHGRPHAGRYIRKGRGRLAANLAPIQK